MRAHERKSRKRLRTSGRCTQRGPLPATAPPRYVKVCEPYANPCIAEVGPRLCCTVSGAAQYYADSCEPRLPCTTHMRTPIRFLLT